MEIVVETSAGHGDLTIAGHGPSSTLADVVEQVTGARAPAVVCVDGHVVPSSTSLAAAGVRNGSALSLDEADRAGPFDDTCAAECGSAVVELVQAAGPGAGRRRRLTPGRYAVGEGRRVNTVDLEPATVARPAFVIDVDERGGCCVTAVSDEVTIDGIAVDEPTPWSEGTLLVADRAFVLHHERRPRSHSAAATTSSGLVHFNRPPRQAPDTSETVLDVPDGGREVGERRRLPVLAMVAPVPVAAAIAVLMARPMMLLFALLSPMMMLANWIEERRAGRRQASTSRRADDAAEADFRLLVQRARAAEQERLRAVNPHIATLISRAATCAPALWERRPGSHDAWRIPLGLADRDWTPELRRGTAAIATADRIVAAAGPLTSVPVVADLATERGTAIVGPRAPATAAARGFLLAAATVHGPADLDVVICSDPERAAQWEWVKWLPHARRGSTPHLLTDRDRIASWASSVRAAAAGDRQDVSRLTLVVVDVVAWWHDRDSPLRGVLAESRLPLRYLIVSPDAPSVPSLCTTLITIPPRRAAPSTFDDLVAQRRFDIRPFSVDADLAVHTARALAPVQDSDVAVADHAELPERQTILGLLGVADPTARAITDRWRAAGRAPRPRARVGVTALGPLEVDLVDDGPHGLIAGTTGAGKSELLRSLVASLAASLPPDHLNFVLIDFKGGAAFDACADLPHTVSMVTDLDEHLAGRVLRCLRAELHHRELILRAAGATSLDEYQLLDDVDPLPRLVLVVDEFATVAAELPDFVPSLVDIAQRGRSLGTHMVLATQRPAGVVDGKIKANTNLRVALRVQDDGDSIDVIGQRDAAALPRTLPGRAYARFGAGDVVEFQSAYSTGTTADGVVDQLSVRPWAFGRPPTAVENDVATNHIAREAARASTEDDGPSDLDRLVDAIRDAASELGQLTQRRPAPEPLPASLPVAELLAQYPGAAVPVGLVDLPDEQRQAVRWWTPGVDGSLLVYGVSGAGTSSLLASLAVGLTDRYSPDDVHLYAIDADTNLLDPFGRLPHCGAVVAADDVPRVARLCAVLADEVSRRKRLAIELGGPARVIDGEPAVVLLIDNIGALRQALEDDRDLSTVWATLEGLVRDGQGLGVCTVVTAKHERALPATMVGQYRRRLVMRLADRVAYTSFGFRSADVPTFVPGRALDPEDHTELQVASPPSPLADTVTAAAQRWSHAGRRRVMRVDALPTAVALQSVLHAAVSGDDGVRVPVGLDTSTARPAMLAVDDGGAVFVTGPARSGRSTQLAVIAHGVLAASTSTAVFAICPRRSPLAAVPGLAAVASEPAAVAPVVERVVSGSGRRLLLVDDADRLAGPSFVRLAGHDCDELSIVLAGRADELRSMDHWSRPLQRSRTGVLLRPLTTDGDLLRTSLPLRLQPFGVGQGFVVDDGRLVPLLAARLGGS